MKQLILTTAILTATLAAQSLAPLNEEGKAVGALAPSAIAKSKAKPGFDITGTWLHGGGANNPWQFAPPAAGFKLTP
ncbi:MAG: hypothetical protein ABI995_14240, partial [Acidobacteriota bacterium]